MSCFLKCKKCRNILICQDETSVLDMHSQVINKVSNSISLDCVGKIIDVWYLQENELPEWIINSLNKAEWQKGKLKCPSCNAKIGSFDFISGSKCTCKEFLLPSVHIVKSKCDIFQK